ncbi:TPA: hypothetical protein ACH3X2_012897 [Trebouxia sp. C0005]
MVGCILQEHDKQAENCLQLHSQSEALQAVSGKVAAAEAAAGAAEARAEAAGACAAEEVKRRDELVQTHAAELADLQHRLQAAQENAEDSEVVANKLASAKAWLADLRKQQKQLDAAKKHVDAGKEQLDADREELDAEREKLEAEENRLVVCTALLAKAGGDVKTCQEERRAASKRLLADPADLAADLERGFKLEPAVLSEAQLNAGHYAGVSEFAALEQVLATHSRKRHRSS